MCILLFIIFFLILLKLGTANDGDHFDVYMDDEVI